MTLMLTNFSLLSTTLQVLLYLILIITLWGRVIYQPHFTDEEIEAANGSGICPWSAELVSTKVDCMY